MLFLRRFLALLEARRDAVERGDAEPWAGLGLSRHQARRQTGGAIQGVIVAPAQKHLDEIRGNLEGLLVRSGAAELMHPDPFLAAHERPAETWFVCGEAAGVIRYFVGTRASQLVGSRASILWLSESGLLDDVVWRSVQPLLWEQKADVIAEGTPAFDEGHWFTRLAVSGLPDGHERADRKIAARNTEVTTYLATSLQAYNLGARAEAARDLEASGEESVYALQEIKADWRLPSMMVFQWHPDRHLATVTEDRSVWTIAVNGRVHRVREQPQIVGGIDWFRGVAPAGAVVTAIWRSNPIRIPAPTRDDERATAADPRPLIVALDEVSTEKDETYTDDGYVGKLVALQKRWGVGAWYQDPFSPKLTKLARSKGLAIRDTDASEKGGRLALIGRALHCTDTIEPALLVSQRCRRLPGQLARYRWARKRDGTPTGKPIQYDDWLIDGLAYIVPHVGGVSVRGGPWGS
jgi:hypothetical protein